MEGICWRSCRISCSGASRASDETDSVARYRSRSVMNDCEFVQLFSRLTSNDERKTHREFVHCLSGAEYHRRGSDRLEHMRSLRSFDRCQSRRFQTVSHYISLFYSID